MACFPATRLGIRSAHTLQVPSSLLAEKIARNPLQFGMIVGFMGLPLLWMAGDSLVNIAIGQGHLPIEAFWKYEASGALPGAFLGAQGVRIWSSRRVGKLGEAKSLAVWTGALGVAFYVLQSAYYARVDSPFWLVWLARLAFLVVQHNLPFLLFLLFLFGGLFARRR